MLQGDGKSTKIKECLTEINTKIKISLNSIKETIDKAKSIFDNRLVDLVMRQNFPTSLSDFYFRQV
jgi:hypothetical protein